MLYCKREERAFFEIFDLNAADDIRKFSGKAPPVPGWSPYHVIIQESAEEIQADAIGVFFGQAC